MDFSVVGAGLAIIAAIVVAYGTYQEKQEGREDKERRIQFNKKCK